MLRSQERTRGFLAHSAIGAMREALREDAAYVGHSLAGGRTDAERHNPRFPPRTAVPPTGADGDASAN